VWQTKKKTHYVDVCKVVPVYFLKIVVQNLDLKNRMSVTDTVHKQKALFQRLYATVG